MGKREVSEEELKSHINQEIVEFLRENRAKIVERALIRLKKITTETKATREESAQNEEKLR